MMGLEGIIYEYLERLRHDLKLKDNAIYDKWGRTIDNFLTTRNLSKVITEDTEKFDEEFSKVYYVNDCFSNIWSDDTSNALDEYGIRIYLYIFVNRVGSSIFYWVENENGAYIFGNL